MPCVDGQLEHCLLLGDLQGPQHRHQVRRSPSSFFSICIFWRAAKASGTLFFSLSFSSPPPPPKKNETRNSNCGSCGSVCNGQSCDLGICVTCQVRGGGQRKTTATKKTSFSLFLLLPLLSPNFSHAKQKILFRKKKNSRAPTSTVSRTTRSSGRSTSTLGPTAPCSTRRRSSPRGCPTRLR